MHLSIEGVRLIERDPMPARRDRANDATVVRRRAVPVGADQARGEEGDLERWHIVRFLLVVGSRVHGATLPSWRSWRRGLKLVHDLEQLVDAVRAGVAR